MFNTSTIIVNYHMKPLALTEPPNIRLFVRRDVLGMNLG